MSIESRTRRLLDQIEDLPDWSYMKAVEVSRALDEQPLDSETLGVWTVMMLTGIERRLHALESNTVDQQEFNLWAGEWIGELAPGSIEFYGDERPDE